MWPWTSCHDWETLQFCDWASESYSMINCASLEYEKTAGCQFWMSLTFILGNTENIRHLWNIQVGGNTDLNG